MSETFTKAERLCSQKLIDQLFAGGSASMAAFPLRAVYRLTERREDDAAPVSVLISVPKKRLRLAVDRNRMKRQVREAYRRNKQSLCERLIAAEKHIDMAFICICDQPVETLQVEASVKKILRRLDEHLSTL